MWRKGKGRFDIGVWSKKRKKCSDEFVLQNSVLKQLDNQVTEVKENIQQLKVKVCKLIIISHFYFLPKYLSLTKIVFLLFSKEIMPINKHSQN